MAIRIFDQTVGQLAGIPVVTTGKGALANDGLTAYAQLVSYVDGSGVATDIATETTQLLNYAELQDLNTPAAYLPPEPAVDASDGTFSRGTINLSAVSGDQTIVAGVASQTTRVYRLFATFTAGASESLVTVKRGATAIGYFRVPTTGLVVDRVFCSYAHYQTGTNEAWILSPSVAVNIAGDFLYQTSA